MPALILAQLLNLLMPWLSHLSKGIKSRICPQKLLWGMNALKYMKGLGSIWHKVSGICVYHYYCSQRSSTCFLSARKFAQLCLIAPPNTGVLQTCGGQAPHLSLFHVSAEALHEESRGRNAGARPPCLWPALPPVAEVSEIQQGAQDPAALPLSCLG